MRGAAVSPRPGRVPATPRGHSWNRTLPPPGAGHRDIPRWRPDLLPMVRPSTVVVSENPGNARALSAASVYGSPQLDVLSDRNSDKQRHPEPRDDDFGAQLGLMFA